MFKKFQEAYQNFNSQKLKKDLEVGKKRAVYYFNDFKKKASNSDAYSKLKNYAESAKDNMNKEGIKKKVQNMESNYIKKRDSYVQSMTERFNKSKLASKMNTFTNKFRGTPTHIQKYTKTFFSDTRSFLSDSYQGSKLHVRNYFKANRKLFQSWKDSSGRFFKKSGRRVFLIFGSAAFLFGLGSNLPHAIANYQLQKENLKVQANNQIKPEKSS